MASESNVECAISSMVNSRCLWLEYARALHEVLVVPVLLHDSKILIWRGKQRS